ncbi:MAG TPA: hypothetical protein VK395_06480 [Gemmataceae bacterium]|nr:hypothetical protein [Gemmataceae bacterium]
MSYSTYFVATLASMIFGTAVADDKESSVSAPTLDEALSAARQRIQDLVDGFRRGSVSPVATAQFEKDLQQALREEGRSVVEWTYNHLEPADVNALPPAVHFEGSSYRRLAKKTRQKVSTLFGTISLQWLGYRAAAAEGEPVLFPLCRTLGVVQGTTPALLECVARYQAESGATQQRTLTRLRQEHGVAMGVKRLRQVIGIVAEAMAEHRAEAQAEQVLAWLKQADASSGRHRPVLSVGRDGITLGVRIKGCSIYEVATTGTLTVHDRRGRRLGTVYLAQTPEPGQGTMSSQLTELLQEVLGRWQGPLPRLCYVTDAGDSETSYYKKELRRLRHPRTGQRLEWFWVVDYYHASERLWKMAEALFGVGKQSWGWARKMQKLLLKPGGVGRLLHSAAALRGRRSLTGKRLAEFKRAYKYLQTRREHVRYAEYRRLGMPIGSGVTEAACKTVYTQRLKLSGMRWHKKGAQKILQLRVILLSGVWSQVHERILKSYSEVKVGTPDQLVKPTAQKAA